LNYVIPKKSLGQHFLTDANMARKIVNSLTLYNYDAILEIGPGMGILTEFLLLMNNKEVKFVEIDEASVSYLEKRFPDIKDKIIKADILSIRLNQIFNKTFAIIGNFPYNISSQLFFKILEFRSLVIEVVCMIQKEVAVRIASPPGSKNYGILSVLLQTYYDINYLFSVPPQVFKPPPKVQSAVIKLTRNQRRSLECNEDLFVKVVKTSFNQRRKIIRNSLKNILLNLNVSDEIFQKRPEQLTIDEFVILTRLVEKSPGNQNGRDLDIN
jgi:16S rRNA (adenine1518-N6/adenine1519-N6)-dimethyltransferase